jgi:hypothetical protein
MIFHAMLMMMMLLDSKDVAVVFCVALVRTGAGALAVAAQTFTK